MRLEPDHDDSPPGPPPLRRTEEDSARRQAVRSAMGAAVPSGTVRRAPSAYVREQKRRDAWLMNSAAAALAAVVLGGAAAYGIGRLQRRRRTTDRGEATPHEDAARRLYQGAALLSLSVLTDSTLEHYRGDFKNRAMFIAPAVSGMTLAATLWSGADPQGSGSLRRAVFATATLTGVVGTGFHVYNIWKREGGFDWLNLFYGAPLGAPAAISWAGLFGLIAGRLGTGDAPGRRPPALFGMSSGRILGGLSSVGLLGTVAEVWLLHFRGAFQNPFMYVPVTVPPLTAGILGLAVTGRSPAALRAARVCLAGTAAIGFAGVGFHAYGISRNMGGWKNWSQMILQGPPLPAPPSFTGMALAGLGALQLIEEAR